MQFATANPYWHLRLAALTVLATPTLYEWAAHDANHRFNHDPRGLRRRFGGTLSLAALNSAEEAPPIPLLVAEVEGELPAALSLQDSSVIGSVQAHSPPGGLAADAPRVPPRPFDGRRLHWPPRLRAA
jgi:hypothetical protein